MERRPGCRVCFSKVAGGRPCWEFLPPVPLGWGCGGDPSTSVLRPRQQSRAGAPGQAPPVLVLGPLTTQEEPPCCAPNPGEQGGAVRGPGMELASFLPHPGGCWLQTEPRPLQKGPEVCSSSPSPQVSLNVVPPRHTHWPTHIQAPSRSFQALARTGVLLRIDFLHSTLIRRSCPPPSVSLLPGSLP